MSKPEPISPAQTAYEAYCYATGGILFATGQTLPIYANLSPEIRNAWTAAASAVVQMTQDSFMERIHSFARQVFAVPASEDLASKLAGSTLASNDISARPVWLKPGDDISGLVQAELPESKVKEERVLPGEYLG